MSRTSNETTVTKDFWPKLKKSLASVPFAEEVIAAYYCAFDPATPLKVKGILLGALVYFIMPFDVIPDLLLGLGFTDDMAVLYTAISLIRSHMTQAHRDKAKVTLEKLKAETI
ncbi:MAG TPA: YkvA family protein [Aestuariivirga sp.]|nr:YkvA family protein [Aestuariivirga sp.]